MLFRMLVCVAPVSTEHSRATFQTSAPQYPVPASHSSSHYRILLWSSYQTRFITDYLPPCRPSEINACSFVRVTSNASQEYVEQTAKTIVIVNLGTYSEHSYYSD